MEKPNYAPNFIGDLMNNCWKKEPKDRPTFNQREEIIRGKMESAISAYYSNLDAPYQKFNDDKAAAPNKTERFVLLKMLNEEHQRMKSHSLPAVYDYDVSCHLNA